LHDVTYIDERPAIVGCLDSRLPLYSFFYMCLVFFSSVIPSIDRPIIGSARQDGPQFIFKVVHAMGFHGINRSIDRFAAFRYSLLFLSIRHSASAP
jgi:hypothetical protein